APVARSASVWTCSCRYCRPTAGKIPARPPDASRSTIGEKRAPARNTRQTGRARALPSRSAEACAGFASTAHCTRWRTDPPAVSGSPCLQPGMTGDELLDLLRVGGQKVKALRQAFDIVETGR